MRLALILGGADCLFDDIEAALELTGPGPIIIATNHAGRDYHGHVDHWVSMHAELLAFWANERAKAGRGPAGRLWSAAHRQGGTSSIDRIASPGGSSGLLAVFVGLELGLDRLILCGVPMQPAARHYDDMRPWTEARQYLPAWRRAVPTIVDRVRSMSGATADLLGRPDEEWLNGENPREASARRAAGKDR
jgi:hypothetical protein